jgi:type III secretion system YscQ/HrcQ family protein
MLDSNETTRVMVQPVEATPFDWGGLPAVSRRNVSLTNALRRRFVRAAGELEALGVQLESLTGLRHRATSPTIRVVEENIEPELGQGFVTRFFAPPAPEAGVLAVDRLLVDRWLESLWGEPAAVRRPESIEPADFGLVTYLCLRTAGWLTERGGPTVVFPTEAPPWEWAIEELNTFDAVVEIDMGLETDSGRGMARLWLPAPMAQRLASNADAGASAQLLEDLVAGPFGGLNQRWPVSLARLALTVDECLALRPGDVLLPTEHGLQTDAFEPTSPGAFVRVSSSDGGFGRATVLSGRVAPGPDCWQLTLNQLTPTTRRVRPMDDAFDEQANDEAPTAEQPTELLAAPSVAVDVQVGTATLTLREVSELTGGQVIELDRRVGEPLDLYVDGQKLGRGELVDIEGELGVRLLELDKS